MKEVICLPLLAERLGVFKPWHWVFNRPPWAVVLIFALIAPFNMWFIDILVVRGTIVHPTYQWYGAWLGDILLAFAGGLMAMILRESPTLPPFRRRGLVHGGILLFWCAFSAWHMWQESSQVNTWERRFSPNGVYHAFFIYPFLGYALTVLIIATFFRARVRHMREVAAQILVIFLIVGYGTTLYYDAANQVAPDGVSKHYYANPPDPWCHGLITRHICG